MNCWWHQPSLERSKTSQSITHTVYNDLKDMRLPILLVVAKKTNELNIDCSLGEGVKLWSVALWERLVKIFGHSDCRLTSSDVAVVDLVECKDDPLLCYDKY